MKCHVCGATLADCDVFYPVDPPGTEGRRWACEKHFDGPIDPEVKEIVDVITGDNDEQA